MTDQPTPPLKPARRRWLWAAGLLGLALVGLLFAAGLWLFVLQRDFMAPGPTSEEHIILLEPGTSLSGAGRMLAREGMVADAWRFRIAARLLGAQTPILAGEYAVPAGASMAQILAIMQSGIVVQHRFTVPEGSTVADVLAWLEAEPLLRGVIDTPPPEGSLMPETYYFVRHDDRQSLLNRMRDGMDRLLDDLWAARAQGLPLATPDEALVLASIVERETALADERPRIAAVFLNRLRKNMRLQSDPTVIYGVSGGKMTRPLSQTDLKTKTAYNTYQIDGLPPTPIANPGRAALAAVLNPLASDELYFVADGSGGHVFARTHADHRRNVARWRKIEAERRKQEANP